MANGKGDKRRPATVDDRQLEFNWTRTFTKVPNDKSRDEAFQQYCNTNQSMNNE